MPPCVAQFSWMYLLLQILCPIFNKHLWRKSKPFHEQHFAKTLFKAVGLSLVIAHNEHKVATSDAVESLRTQSGKPQKIKMTRRHTEGWGEGSMRRGKSTLKESLESINQKARGMLGGTAVTRLSVAARAKLSRTSKLPPLFMLRLAAREAYPAVMKQAKQEVETLESYFDHVRDEGTAIVQVERRTLRDFYSIPVVKVATRGIAHSLHFAVQVTMLTKMVTHKQLLSMYPLSPLFRFWNDQTEEHRDSTQEFLLWYAAWCFLECCRCIDQWWQYTRNRHKQLTDRFHSVEIASSLAGMTAIAIELAVEFIDVQSSTMTTTFDYYMVALSIKLICSSWMFLRFFSVYEPLGVLVIMIQKMAADMTVFLTLFSVVTLGFTLAMYAHDKAGFLDTDQDDIFHPTGSVWITLWALFGEFDPDIFVNSLSAGFIWLYILLSAVRACTWHRHKMHDHCCVAVHSQLRGAPATRPRTARWCSSICLSPCSLTLSAA